MIISVVKVVIESSLNARIFNCFIHAADYSVEGLVMLGSEQASGQLALAGKGEALEEVGVILNVVFAFHDY